MTGSVTITAGELSNRAIKVGEDILLAGQSKRVDVNGSLTIEETDVPEGVFPAAGTLPGATTGDIFTDGDTSKPNHGNPNGNVVAEIGPKLPKASGELKDVEEGGRLVQRPVVEGEGTAGRSTQGGGENAEGPEGKTPGPQPDSSLTGTVAQTAAATGTIDATGRPSGESTENVSKTAQGQKAPAGAAKK